MDRGWYGCDKIALYLLIYLFIYLIHWTRSSLRRWQGLRSRALASSMRRSWPTLRGLLRKQTNWTQSLDSFNAGRFAELAWAAKPRLGEFNAQELANTAWAFAHAIAVCTVVHSVGVGGCGAWTASARKNRPTRRGRLQLQSRGMCHCSNRWRRWLRRLDSFNGGRFAEWRGLRSRAATSSTRRSWPTPRGRLHMQQRDAPLFTALE